MDKKDIKQLPVILNQEKLQSLIDEKDEYKDRLEVYNTVMEKVELFLTFWYKNTTEFGKIRDDFNDSDEVNAKLRVKNERVKIKIDNIKQ